jgi:hypothetical protein
VGEPPASLPVTVTVSLSVDPRTIDELLGEDETEADAAAMLKH